MIAELLTILAAVLPSAEVGGMNENRSINDEYPRANLLNPPTISLRIGRLAT